MQPVIMRKDTEKDTDKSRRSAKREEPIEFALIKSSKSGRKMPSMRNFCWKQEKILMNGVIPMLKFCCVKYLHLNRNVRHNG